MKKTVLTFGLIAGAILSAMMIISLPFHDQIGFDRAALLGYSTMVLAFLLIFFGVRSYRDNVLDGTISFGRALKVGGLIALVASACYVATWEVIYFGTDSDYMEKYHAYTIDQARADGETEAEIAKRQADFEKYARWYQNPAINVAATFIEPLPVGLVLTLVTAGVLSRKKGSSTESGMASVRA
jgi:hypothetical protein